MNKYYIQYSNNPENNDWTNFKGLDTKKDCYWNMLAHLQAPRIASEIEWTSGFRWAVRVGDKITTYRIVSSATQMDVKYSVTEYMRLSQDKQLIVRADC